MLRRKRRGINPKVIHACRGGIYPALLDSQRRAYCHTPYRNGRKNLVEHRRADFVQQPRRPYLPNYPQVIKALQRDGWVVVRHKGSHVRLQKHLPGETLK